MKTPTTVSVFLLICSISLQGQQYFPFPAEDAQWNVYLLTTCDNDSPPDTFLLRYALHGDTVINDLAYGRLCLETGDIADPIIEPVGGIREEGKKIYYIGQGFLGSDLSEEVLLYDFTAMVGDTIDHTENGSFRSIVLDVDSILIAGEYRKQYTVDNGWYYHNPDHIVEGIGSIKNGLLGHVSDIPTCGTHFWEHVCFSENGEVKYRNPVYSDCYAGTIKNNADPYQLTGGEVYDFDVGDIFHYRWQWGESDNFYSIYRHEILSKDYSPDKTSVVYDIQNSGYNVGLDTETGTRTYTFFNESESLNYFNLNDPIVLTVDSLDGVDSIFYSQELLCNDTVFGYKLMGHGYTQDYYGKGLGRTYHYESGLVPEEAILFYFKKIDRECGTKDVLWIDDIKYPRSSVTIYPNPASGMIMLETDEAGPWKVRISNLNGQLIYSKKFEGYSHQIDLSSFQRGVYFITVRTRDFVVTRKIVKNSLH